MVTVFQTQTYVIYEKALTIRVLIVNRSTKRSTVFVIRVADP